MNNKKADYLWIYVFCLFGIFIIGILLRAVEIINGNYLFGFDHGRDYLAAYSIVENRKQTLIGAEVGAGSAGLTGLFHGPGFFYLIALMYILFGGDPYGGLVLMFVFGLFTLVATYIYFSKISGRLTGLLMLFLISVSPLIAPQSRFIWNHHLSSFFIVLALYFTYAISVNPLIYAPLSLFTAGFIYHFELAIAVPIAIGIILSMIFVYKIRTLKIYLYSIFAMVLSVLPMILFEIRHGFMATSGMIKYLLAGQSVSLGQNSFKDHILSYIYNAKDAFIIENGLFNWQIYTYLSLVLLIGSFVYAFKTKNQAERKFILSCLAILASSYILFLKLQNTIWDYYLIHAHFIYAYFFALFGGKLLINYKKNILTLAGAVITVLFLFSMVKSTWQRILINYKYDLYDYGGTAKIRGKRDIIDYVYQQNNFQPFNVKVFTPPIYTYPYDYLLLTYGRKKYGFSPGSDKKGDLYLIIEVDDKDWYKGWLETVIGDGEILATEYPIKGYMVQHRFYP